MIDTGVKYAACGEDVLTLLLHNIVAYGRHSPICFFKKI